VRKKENSVEREAETEGESEKGRRAGVKKEDKSAERES